MIMAAVLCAFAGGCKEAPEEARVMARYVPERSDDFVFENNLICGRIYGQALEGNPTSPGIDIWVKTPGALVANQRYIDELQFGKTYHKDWGNGKDCYKVAVSLGGGASVPVVGGQLQYPATNYRSWEILTDEPEKVVFVLHYPQWEAAEGIKVALDKQITVVPDTYFCAVQDTWTFEGTDTLTVAAGIFRHAAQETITDEMAEDGRYAIWEHASDQSVEPEDGMLGVAVVMPGASRACILDDASHGILTAKVVSGGTVEYYFGSCWSKGDVKSARDWFDIVKAQ